MLANHKVGVERMCLPQIKEAADPEADADDDEADENAGEADEPGIPTRSGDVAPATKIIAGWQTSYRSSAPESRPFEHWRKKWSKGRDRYKNVRLLAPQSARFASTRLRMQRTWRLNRRLRRE